MRAKLDQLLLDEGLINKRQLDKAQQSLSCSNESIGRHLINLGYITQENLTRFVAKHYNLPFVNVSKLAIDYEAIKLIPHELAEKHMLIPIFKTEKDISIAFADPTDTATITIIEFMTGLSVIPFAASESEIKNAIVQYYFLPVTITEQK